MMLWMGLQYVIVVFLDHTHLLFIRLCGGSLKGLKLCSTLFETFVAIVALFLCYFLYLAQV